MKGNTWDWLPYFLVLVASAVALQSELQHATCDNEERWENQFMCRGKPFGALAPYPDNCSLFLVCDCEYPTVKECPASLWWDDVNSICNYPQATKCIIYEIVTKPPSTPQTSTTPSLGTTVTTITIPITSTTEEYVSTTTEQPITTTWSTTVEPLSTTSEGPLKAPPGVDESFCNKYEDGSIHKYDYDCNAYINCTNGWPVLNYCEPNKVFNDKMMICDTPETAQCKPLPLPPTTTTAEPTTTTPESTTTTEEPTTTTPEPTTTTPESTTTTVESTITTAEPTTTTVEPTTTTEVAATTTDDGQCTSVPPLGIDEDYCERKGNGFYEYPYDCSAYINCNRGCTYYAYCIADKLYNPQLYICDTPNSVKCNTEQYLTTTTVSPSSDSGSSGGAGDKTTTPIATLPTTVATTTTAGLPAGVDPNMCNNQPDNNKYPSADNCAEYFLCQNNQVIVSECPKPTLYNPDYKICDEVESFVCYGDRTTSTSTTKTTPEPTTTTSSTTLTTLPATTVGPEEFCADKEFGITYPYVQDCRMYFICMGDGTYSLIKCIPGNYYNPRTGQCDGSPTACQEQNTTTTTTLEPTTTTEIVTSTTNPPTTTSVATTTSEAPVQPGGICTGTKEGEMIAYPNDCSKYIVCVSPIPVAFFCMEGLFFNEKQQQCVPWTDSDCGGETSSTPASTQPPLKPTMCTNSSRDTFPYPENCQWFIRCVDDYIYMMDVCKCNEYYDPISEECGADVPPDACRWDYTSTTPESTSTPSPVTRPPPQKGPCDDTTDGELVPYPNDCSKYIKCNRPIPAAFDCDEGFEFSPESRQCLEASVANCNFGPTPGGSTTNFPDTTSSYTSSTATGSSATSDTTTEEKPPETSTTEKNPPTKSSTTQETSTTDNPPTDWSTTPETSTTQRDPPTESSTTEETSTTDNPPTDWSTTPEASTTERNSPTEASTTQGTSTTDRHPPTDWSTTPETSTTEGNPPTDSSTTQEPTTTEETTTEITTTRRPSGGVCGDKKPGTIVPYPDNCGKYIICQEPIPIGYDCPEGLEFSPEKLECMEPESANCRPKPTTPSTSTTPVETTTDESSSESTIQPTSTTPIETTTDESSSESTIQPTSTTPVETTTDESSSESTSTTKKTTTPRTTKKTTTPRTTTTKRTTTPRTTPSATDSTTPAPTTIHPDTPNICCGQPLGTYLGYPNDCNRYVICDYPVPQVLICEDGTAFDVEYLQCTVWAYHHCRN